MTLENFIIDYETYKYHFNNLQKKEELSTLFGNDGVAEVSNYINIFFNKVFPKISHDKKVLSSDDLYIFYIIQILFLHKVNLI